MKLTLYRLRLEAEGLRAGSVVLGRGAYGTVVLGRFTIIALFSFSIELQVEGL